MNKKELSVVERDKSVLEAIIFFKAENDYAPTVREIAKITRRANATVKAALESLEKNGFISTAKMKARTIRVLKVR